MPEEEERRREPLRRVNHINTFRFRLQKKGQPSIPSTQFPFLAATKRRIVGALCAHEIKIHHNFHDQDRREVERRRKKRKKEIARVTQFWVVGDRQDEARKVSVHCSAKIFAYRSGPGRSKLNKKPREGEHHRATNFFCLHGKFPCCPIIRFGIEGAPDDRVASLNQVCVRILNTIFVTLHGLFLLFLLPR